MEKQSPEKKCRRWLLELKLADKREKEWRAEAKKLVKRYHAEERKKNSFNILYSNTETLAPALYNSTPKPDVRRRFRDSDMLGKAVSEVLERALAYSIDAYDFDGNMRAALLDALVPGRGVTRVRYVPSLRQVGQPEEAEEQSHEAHEGVTEELEYEQVVCEHVDWEKFRHGPGKTWEQVTWVAFEIELTKDEVSKRFGAEIAQALKYDEPEDDDAKSKDNEDVSELFKTATLWEVWDRDEKEVFFLSEQWKSSVIYAKDGETDVTEPPFSVKGFFPVPRPLRLVKTIGTCVPVPLYKLYEEQADELDRISSRIFKLVNALRLRGVYDSTVTEMSALMKAGDNDLVPTENAAMWADKGGLDKAITWMPVDMAAKVLLELYKGRESTKQVIYEITGIADILRGSTKSDETLGAQQIKNKWATMRISDNQKEVARFARDTLRLKAEIIAEKFGVDTLGQMTGLKFPTMAEKQQAQMMAQANPQMAQQAQEVLTLPAWEEIQQVMQSDAMREFRVDVETNSTVAETLAEDMEGLREVIGGLVEFWTGSGPAVMAGALPIEAVKSISLTIARRARLGLEVEDALEKMQQPKPEATPEDKSPEAEQIKAQATKEVEGAKLQASQATEQLKSQTALQLEQMRGENAKELELLKQTFQREIEAMKAAHAREVEETKLGVQAELEGRRMEHEMQTGEKQRLHDSAREFRKADASDRQAEEATEQEVQKADTVKQIQALADDIKQYLGARKSVKRNADGTREIVRH